jgi:hypothetical protein
MCMCMHTRMHVRMCIHMPQVPELASIGEEDLLWARGTLLSRQFPAHLAAEQRSMRLLEAEAVTNAAESASQAGRGWDQGWGWGWP